MSLPTIDKIIRSRRKSISLIIEPDGRLVVRAPLRVSSHEIQSLVEGHADWIRARQKIALEVCQQSAPKKYVQGEQFWYLGSLYPLEILPPTCQVLRFDQCFYMGSNALPRAAEVFTHWYRQQARQVITERVNWYAKQHSFSFQKIRISSARTRWGSCSSRGALSFAWRLVMAPLPVIDYVVVHELSHLRYKNHSKKFWLQVGTILPEYKLQVSWLKANGHLLSL